MFAATRSRSLLACLVAISSIGNTRLPQGPQQTTVANVDLAAPFRTRSPWRFTAVQGPEVDDFFADPSSTEKDKLPGAITLCLHKAGSRECDASLSGDLDLARANPYFATSHDLQKFEIVHPRRGSDPLFLVRTANLASGDGDRGILTQILSYDRKNDKYVRIYRQVVGTNNNGEDRYVKQGPLRGDMIEAEQTADVRRGYFGYWVTVRKLTPAFEYRQVLKYRSATRYGDGNPLAVIDSEMPNIQKRLGLWRPGQALPLPAASCPHPRLVRTALWCA